MPIKGGAVDGVVYTNSKEALDKARIQGFKAIEVDFEMTTDNRIVLLHDWGQTLQRLTGTEHGRRSRAEFIRLRNRSQFELLTVEEFVDYLHAHSDFCVISDPKFDNRIFFAWLKQQETAVVNRFIPQIYSIEELSLAREGKVDKVILTLYRSSPHLISTVVGPIGSPIVAITAPHSWIDQFGLEALVAGNRIPVFVHTINNPRLRDYYRGFGIAGFYTDLLSPEIPLDSDLFARCSS